LLLFPIKLKNVTRFQDKRYVVVMMDVNFLVATLEDNSYLAVEKMNAANSLYGVYI